jgi:Fe2+ transport system protein B
MAYKRTTSKTGASSRKTTTYNTKTGKTTQSYSSKPKGSNHRITQSSSNGTHRITNTYTDQMGYITKESHTLGETNTQRKKRQAAETRARSKALTWSQTKNSKKNNIPDMTLGQLFGIVVFCAIALFFYALTT